MAVFCAAAFAATWLGFWLLSWQPESTPFTVLVFVTLGSHVAVVLLLGLGLHRDFFSLFFQIVAMYVIVVLRGIPLYSEGPSLRQWIRSVHRVSLIVFVLGFVWLMMMGYAISTRQEPRWAESIVYNIYFSVLLFILFLSIVQNRERLFRQVHVTPQRFVVDEFDFSELLGTVNLRILYHMVETGDSPVTCSHLRGYLSPTDEAARDRECSECLSKNYKASLCAPYRNLANRVRDIRKLLESADVGTIVSPENKMRVLTEGWRLRLFEGVHVHRRGPAAPAP